VAIEREARLAWPQHPIVTAERREAKRRYRLRKEIREREAAQLAAERDDDDAGDAGIAA
jgi:hypothetical protein